MRKLLATILTSILVIFVVVQVNAQQWHVYSASVLPPDNNPAFYESNTKTGVPTWTIKDDPDIPGNNYLEMLSPNIPGVTETAGMWKTSDFDPVPTKITVITRVKAAGDVATYEEVLDLDMRISPLREKLIIGSDNMLDFDRADVNITPEGFDVAEWHTYRITFDVTTGNVALYLEEVTTPVLTAITTSSESSQYFRFGDGSNGKSYGALIDWIAFDTTGAYAPGQGSPIPDSLFVDKPAPTPVWQVYDASLLPPDNNPAFSESNLKNPPDTTSWIVDDPLISNNKLLRFINAIDPAVSGTQSKFMWGYKWNMDAAVGATIVFRVKALDLPAFHRIFEVEFRDGTNNDKVFVVSDGEIELDKADIKRDLPSGFHAWHTYRVTFKNAEASIYLDEEPTPFITGTTTSTSSSNDVRFGDGSDSYTYGFLLDWFICDVTGAYAPGEGAAIPETLFVDKQDELIAHWKLDETSGLTAADELGFSHGALRGMGGTEWVAGQDGNALDFAAGSDTAYVLIPDNEVLNFDSTSSFSISALVNADPILSTDEDFLVFKGAQSRDETKGWYGRWYSLGFKSQEIRLVVDDDVTKTQLGVKIGNIYRANEWVHIVGVRDRDEDSLKIYLDGKLIGAMLDLTEKDISTDGLPFYLGNYNVPASGRKLGGQLDDVRIYNYALSATEIASMFDAYDISLPLKVAHWKFDETEGLKAADELGTSDGTLVKMAGTEWIAGQVGNAIDFSATGDSAHILVPHNSVIEFDNQSFSVSYLIKVDPSLSGNIFMKGTTDFDTTKGWYGIWYQSEIKSREIRFAIDDNGGQREYKFTDTDSSGKTQVGYKLPATFTAEYWIHFVGVRNTKEDSVKIYVNGMQVAAKLDVTTQIGVDLPLIIGNNHISSNRFDGLIDELQFYNYALSAAQIKTLFDSYGISTSVNRNREVLPTEYSLEPNYPNPFNPETKIKFAIPQAGHTTITIYNIMGQVVATLIDRKLEPGIHEITLKADNLTSGVYFYKIKSGDFTKIRKMTLMK